MDAKKIIDAIQLPTLSKTLFEIIEVEKANSISFLDDIKKIVERDPLLSAHVLKVANSPLYGFSQRVRTISHAIGLLGVRKIRNMAFSFSIFDFLKKVHYKAEYGNVFNLILKKSLLNSAIATILAKKVDYLNSEELYVSGLLTEIGQMILFLHAPDKYCKIYTVSDNKLMVQEKKIFHIDHVEMGIAFCDRYNLPDFFKNAVQYHSQLQSDEEHCKIAFIANQITELLLIDDEEEKADLFKVIENHTKKLLHLSLSEIEETIKTLPGLIEAFTDDFPEMQKDLNKIIETGSTLIISLMKKEMDMVIRTKELSDSQKKLAKEKRFLTHMLNLSYFFSSLMDPLRTISSLFEYFDNFINEFTIEFIYKDPSKGNFAFIKNKDNLNGAPLNINLFANLMKSKISNEAVRLDKNEMKRLGKNNSLVTLVFPISYHHNFFGFLLLSVDKENYPGFDVEMTYVQILSNIIANSFQNYRSFEGLKNETNKKKLVTQELFKFDRELNHSRENIIELQKSEILGDLLPIIFHKLKNKLTPILGYSQILLAKVEEKSINDRIKKIEKNANELASQLNTLRDYFKSEKVTEERDNLNNVLSRLKDYFSGLEANHDIDITVEKDRMLPDDMINSGQVEALITNIVDNSVIAINEKDGGSGIISITTRNLPESNSYSLLIRDNGTGIKDEDLHRIWTPFYAGFPDHPGIGLTVCEKVISNHNASYEVRSEEGHFAEFEITFKRKLEDGDILPVGIGAEVPKLKKQDVRGKILIVDDEAYLLDLMKEILLNEGNFEVVTTTSGSDAIQMIDGTFDLVISDIRMPGVSGMELYDYLKSRHMDDKVIMVTADPYSEDVAAFLKENNIEYLKKPFELMKFKQHVLDKIL
jgi:HD-like signal output (HDOD) protein/signal transduction histidine kinase/CheY-like chemotaxis protein